MEVANNRTYINQIMSLIKEDIFHTSEILWVCDAATGDFYIDNKFYLKTGYKNDTIFKLKEFLALIIPREDNALEKKLNDLIEGKCKEVQMEFKLRCAGGAFKMFMLRASYVNTCSSDGFGCRNGLIAGSMLNLDEKRAYESEIKNLAYYDSLTKLPNVSMFIFKASAVLSNLSPDRSQGAVVCINIDQFKSINSSYGRQTGNEVLCCTANIVKNSLAGHDLIARSAGDSFLIFLPNAANDIKEIEQKIKKILKDLKAQININGCEIGITCSAGIALYPKDGEGIEELIINAELAMYQAKLEGRNTYCFFNNKIKAKLNNDREISESLKPAMDRKELYLVFQPQIDILSGKITGAEALLRWESKEHGNIPPGVFIPIAEATGLIYDIGNWVLEEACSHCKRWNDEGMELSVAVNVSPVQIKREGFCEEVMNILKKTEIPPDKLQLEITECSLVQNFSKAASMLSFFKERGVRVALDDFGTGYSSFSYLKQLPIDVIKIDREYIKNLEADVRERAITGSIIALTHVLGMEVIAEGIETKEQFEYLKKIGCNTAQGYYLSKPLKLEDFKIFLQKKQWCA